MLIVSKDNTLLEIYSIEAFIACLSMEINFHQIQSLNTNLKHWVVSYNSGQFCPMCLGIKKSNKTRPDQAYMQQYIPLPSNSIHQLLPSEFLYHLRSSKEKRMKRQKLTEIDYQSTSSIQWGEIIYDDTYLYVWVFVKYFHSIIMNSEKNEEISLKNKCVLKNRMILQN